MTNSFLRHYSLSIFAGVIAMGVGFLIGGFVGGFLTVGLLSILEVSLSFDNAVVNAAVLQNWSDPWRKAFVTWGIWVAVFGMRLFLPIAMVAVLSHIGFLDVIMMAIQSPANYAKELVAHHNEIAGFGGAFLALVALDFFLEERDVYWVEWIESKIQLLGRIDAVSVAITLASAFGISRLLPTESANPFFFAAVWGVICFVLAHGLGSILGGDDLANKVIKASVAGFVYLEILDASFSFDGVIGAFALSNNIFIIALGLGTGALFVRSMTLHLVEAGVLSEYRYLEHGAFYAIAALAVIMLMTPIVQTPELVTGLLGAGFIGIAFIHSLMVNRAEANAPAIAETK